MSTWNIYRGNGERDDARIHTLPEPPPWREFEHRPTRIGTTYKASDDEIELVNAALHLRRPLLITGGPGSGKSSLAYAVAHELGLGEVLRWSITTRSTLEKGLYEYDAIGRLQAANFQQMELERKRHLLQMAYEHKRYMLARESFAAGQDDDAPAEEHRWVDDKPPASLPDDDDSDSQLPPIGNYVQLGPLGTALVPSDRPRVLLIDEIDKSDIDLPNDLLHVFEEGKFVIPELARLPQDQNKVQVKPWDYDAEENNTLVTITGGHVRCTTFPLVIMTSNGERDFPPAFLRRCLRLDIKPPDRPRLREVIEAHLGPEMLAQAEPLITEFLRRRDDEKEKAELATDQLLNAVYLLAKDRDPLLADRTKLLEAVLQSLSG